MVKYILYALLMLPLVLASSCEKSHSKPGTETYQDIADQFASAWNKHDPKALAEFWTKDGDLLSPWTAQVYVGRSDIEKHFAEEHSDGMKDSKIKLDIENVRLIDPDTAFVDMDLTISGMKVADEEAAPFHSHGVFLFVKNDGKWKILVARPY